MSEKLRVRDYRFLIICFAICAASLWIGIRYFYFAFPEASIDFRVDRESSRPVAETFASAQEIQLLGYQHAATFQYDEDTKVFLERELGLEQANSIMESDIRLWRWAHRWFKPLQKEEVRVHVSTRGQIADFQHIIPEDAPGEDLTAEAARSIAESFLVLEMGRPIGSLIYLESQTQKRPKRTDHVFTWRIAGMEYAGASYRASVAIQGGRVDGYSEFLKIPEEWGRAYTRLRSLNESTTQVDILFFALLGVAMVVTLGRRIRMRDVRWKTALGFAVVAFVLQFLGELNLFPLREYSFDTASSYGSFVGGLLLNATLTGLAISGVILLLTASSEPLYREGYPGHLSISRLFTWDAIRTRSFFLASAVGITLTFFFFAYEIGFYLLARRFGAWSPADIPYTDLLNTRIPWVFVLLGGFFPAVSEEWMFRSFSIPYLKGLLRKPWVAIVLSSFIWGFGHANYPNQPFFIRGIEVGIVGLILSWAMLRFGILAPLIAHYSIDAVYSAFLLLRSGNPYFVASGAVTAGINLIPFLVAGGAYLVRRTFRNEASLTNAAEGTVTTVAVEPSPTPAPRTQVYLPLRRIYVYAGFLLFAFGLLITLLRPARLGQEIQFRVSRTGAEEAASSFLDSLDFEPQQYRRAAQTSSRVDSDAAQYIYGSGGIPVLSRVYGTIVQPQVWLTRFYRPLEKDEFRVTLNPSTGEIVGFRHELPEDAKGADLPEPQARGLAAAFLRERGYDLAAYELKETQSEKLKARRDTEFVWEAKPGTPGAVGEARVRLQADVKGSRIGNLNQFVKVPEEWRRERERQHPYRIAVVMIRSFFLLTILGLAALAVFRGTREGAVRWSLAFKLAGIAMLVEILHQVNSIPEHMFRYDTSWEMRVFSLSLLVEIGLTVIGIGLAVSAASGLIMACFPSAPSLLKRVRGTAWRRDTLVAAAATLGVFLILQAVISVIQYHGQGLALAPDIQVPGNLVTYLPLLSCIRDILLSTLFFSAVLAFAVHLWTRLERSFLLRLAVLLGLVGSFIPTAAVRFSEAALDLIPTVIFIGLAVWLVGTFFRTNYLAYLVSAALLAITRTAFSLQTQGNLALGVQAAFLWGLALALVVALAWRRLPTELPPGTEA